MSLDSDFETAANNARNLSKKPSEKDLLTLYALYKQATSGDNTTSRPGFTDFTGKAKWDAWTEKKGLSQENAKKEYILFVQKLQN